jgi:H+-translocating NAD(P) transhydrogenase subunit alpha
MRVREPARMAGCDAVTRLVVVKETGPDERRVAIVPADVPRLTGLGAEVVVESGAGVLAGYPDSDYERTGASTASLAGALDKAATLLVKVAPPTETEVGGFPQHCTLVCFFPPASNLPVVGRLRDKSVTTYSFDLVPRISRAQTVDALSSQASAAGYEAAVLAARRLGRMFPMLMTAAGTNPPAKVFVMGTGVAGLQAIATARRLGASVAAYDIRPEAADEVRSLGARFVDLPLAATEGTGGYAAEQSADFLATQQELVADTVADSDAVITTAAVPGRHAPRLISAVTVERMRPGSVIVDMAASTGGNCELTVPNEEVDHRGVQIIGAGNLASEVATSSSALFSRNVCSLLSLLIVDGKVTEDPDDEVLVKMCMTRGGRVRHEPTRAAMEGSAE